MAALAVLTRPSLFFTTDRKKEDEICAVFQMRGPFLLPLPCGPKGPSSCLLCPQTSPNSAASHFPSSRDGIPSFQPSHLLFWKSGDNYPFTYLGKKQRGWWAICSSREHEKQFSWYFQVSKWENILGCTGSNVEACPGRPFLLLKLCFGSMVCAILTSRVKRHFAVKEHKS